MPELIPALERHGHLWLEHAIRSKLVGISAATIDRLLSEVRVASGSRRVRRLPTALRRSVPIRTFADWNEPLPGFMEMDLVAHCGDAAAGRFVHTLTLTDIASNWTECMPLLVREGSLVVESVDQLSGTLPFLLRGLDIDNGAEFLNDTLLRYCLAHGVELTRSRPYRKNDQAWVEQKNGSIVRRLVGYRRLEGVAAAEALGGLYETVSEQVKARLRDVMQSLDPLQLLEEIRWAQHQLVNIADGGEAYMPTVQKDDLNRFLMGLSTAWHAGEVRPTHVAKIKPPRHWRTREDPFEGTWPTVRQWLETNPDQTGKELFARLQRENPGVFPDGQLRTLRRRLQQWRTQMARKLVFGVQSRTAAAISTSIAIGHVRDPRSTGRRVAPNDSVPTPA